MKSKTFLCLCCAVVMSVFCVMPAFAHGHVAGEGKNAILVVAFGTSVPEARVALENLENAVREANPDTEVRVAYTSNIIRRKIAAEQNLVIDTPLMALAKLQDEGFTKVVVQPTHFIPGEEYNDLKAVVDSVASIPGKYGFTEIALSEPMLMHEEDYRDAAMILKRAFGKYAGKGKAVVLMGHGTPHFANAAYAQLQLALDKYAPGFVVGTVEGFPSLEEVQARLAHMGAKKVTLVPFMEVAGDHARNDMAGPEEDSWKSTLTADGYKVDAIIKGMGENDEIAAKLVKKLRETTREVF